MKSLLWRDKTCKVLRSFFQALGFFLFTSPLLSSPVVLKMGTLAPQGSSWMKVAEKWSDIIKKETGGMVKIMWYPGGIMGDDPDMVRKMFLGQLHGGGLTGMGLGKISPELSVLYLPFLFENYDEVDVTLRTLGSRFEEILIKKGFVLLGWSEMGFIYLFSKKEIRRFEDIKGVKMWIWAGDPVANAVSEELSDVLFSYSFPVPEVLTGLKAGLVDTFYSSPLATVALQWHTEVNFVIDVPFAYGNGAVVIRKGFFETIPAELRGIVLDGFRNMTEEMVAITREENRIAFEEIIRHGVKPLYIEEEELGRIKDRIKKSYLRLAGKTIPVSLISEIEGVVGNIRSSGKK